MYCYNCGVEIKEGDSFCGHCGARSQAKAVRVSVLEKISKMCNLTQLLTWVCAAILLVSFIVAMNTPYFEFPVVKAGSDGEAELLQSFYKSVNAQVAEEGIEQNIYEIKKHFDGVLSDKDVDLLYDCAKAALTAAQKPSPFNLSKWGFLIARINSDILDAYDTSVLSEIKDGLHTMSIIVFVGFLIALAFILLGGLRRSKVFTFFGMILSGIYTWALSGEYFAAISTTSCVALLVVQFFIDRECKEYCESAGIDV